LSLRRVYGRQGDVFAGHHVGGIRFAGFVFGTVVDVVLGRAAATFDVTPDHKISLQPVREIFWGHFVPNLNIALKMRGIR